ncbi:MAG: hypothetical protein V3V20_09520 [Algisphaera sp.]
MTQSHSSTPPVHGRRHWKRWVLLALFLAVAFFAVRLFQKISAVPAWWQQNQSFLETTQPDELERIARAIEVRAPREWTRPVGQGDGDRTLTFGFDEINAWLALRMNSLLKNQGLDIPDLAGAMFTERDGQLVVAISHDNGKLFQVISVFFEVGNVLADDGDGTPEPTFRIQTIRGGEQNLPLSLIAKIIKPDRIKDPSRKALAQQLIDGQAIGPLILPVDSHRNARIHGFRVTETGIQVDLHVNYTQKPTASKH